MLWLTTLSTPALTVMGQRCLFSLEEADRLSTQKPQSVINNNVKQNPSSVKQITAELEGGEKEETGTLGTEKVGLLSTMKYNIEWPLLLDF